MTHAPARGIIPIAATALEGAVEAACRGDASRIAVRVFEPGQQRDTADGDYIIRAIQQAFAHERERGDATPSTFHLRRAMDLVGFGSSGRRRLGICRVDGEPVRWDYWFPHLGLAVDRRKVADGEADAKAAWAHERQILYFSPQINDLNGRLDTDALVTSLRERWAARMKNGA